MPERAALVTGAFSYTGAAVARSLHARGWTLRTLTNRTTPLQPHPFPVPASPLQMTDRPALTAALRGVQVLVNTYWVRYPHRGVGFEDAVAATGVLLEAAREAGVTRFVQVSVSNPGLDSPLGYYRGKAQVEALVRASALSHAIVRPTLIVDEQDILVNNIAWFLRRFPVFAMPGRGEYRVQPITLAETGELVADAVEAREDLTLDAAGPEVLSFDALVRGLAAALGRRPRVIKVAPWLSLALLRAVGWFVGEVVLTREELAGLMTERLVSREPPRGRTAFSDWVAAHGASLGHRYRSERARHFDQLRPR